MTIKKRIVTVDGLRAFAVLGVIWAHVWMFYKNIAFRIGLLDVHRAISFIGTGVDLFFVISGFCMYLMYARSVALFNMNEFGNFLYRRWKRIAPAFYVIVLAECIFFYLSNGIFPIKDLLAHLFFINTFISNNVLSPPFWSLATEWQFYLLLPFLFIKDPVGKKLPVRLLVLSMISMCFRIGLYYEHQNDLANGVTVLSDKIWYRFIEFAWGICAANFVIRAKEVPRLIRGAGGIVIGFIVIYAGRILMTTDVINRFHSIAFIARSFGEPVLTAGYAILLLNVIESKTIFSRFISLPLFRFIGKISYSMYLWHWIICWHFSNWFINKAGVSALYMNIDYIICTLLVIPVAWLSYQLLEAPYFKIIKQKTPRPTPEKLDKTGTVQTLN